VNLDQAITLARKLLAGEADFNKLEVPLMQEAYDVLAANHSPEARFTNAIDAVAADVHRANVEKGFFADRDSNHANDLIAMLGLIMREASEAMESVREPGAPPMSDKIPDFTNEEEELADTIIRCLDYCDFRQLRIGAAISAKRAFNKTRPHKHGKRA